ncbi:MAG TPA: thiamine phosphate synthase [Pyrinomonadaceae bacterium]|nr:thiamine phosphate synthase [Pyrinomonadaceae bacterium]
MKLAPSKPILYLITRGATAETTTATSAEFSEVLNQVSTAIAAGIDLIQIREKRLTARVLFELAERAVALAQGTSTRILINDRGDVAAGAGAHGVHLTGRSILARTIRKTFGDDFLIGVSTHSVAEAVAARDGAADFAVIGPIFETESKLKYGAPIGLETLSEAARRVAPFPLLALGGVSLANAPQCLLAGASGIAGISLFADPDALKFGVH